MELKDYFKQGVVAPLGYAPNSSSIKPVHIANGLSRAALGEYCDPTVLNRALNRWVKAQERHSTEDLVDDAADRLGEFASVKNRQQLNELRQLLRGVMDADGAVYDKNENCSYTLTHRSHVTRDHNDRGAGDFLFRVLATDLGDGPSPALALLRDLLSDDSDEISVMVAPLTGGEEARTYDGGDAEPPDSLKTRTTGDGRRAFKSAIVREIRKGFDTLATFERSRGSKLHSLRRIVSFSTVSLFLHVINRSLDYEDGRTFQARRPPLLLDFVQGGWSPVAVASHATYNLACKSVERMIAHGLRAAFDAEHGDRWTTRQVEAFIDAVELRGPERARERKRRHFLEVFKSYGSGGHTVSDAFNLAVVDVMLEELSGTPLDYVRALGVRGGLLAPRGQRAVKKRYAPSPELVEVLLAATLGPDEEVQLEQLADRWSERYGILTGARAGDAKELTRFSILDATKENLAANGEALRSALVDIGYARRYADGVTIIRLNAGGA